MADQRFFDYKGPFDLKALAEVAGCNLYSASSAGKSVSEIAPLDKAGSEDISFLDNPKYIESFSKSSAGACVIRERYAERAPKGMHLLITENPYLAFAKIIDHFYPIRFVSVKESIAKSSSIAKSVKLGKNITIQPGAVIAENVEIGDNSHIGANSVIERGVRIGNNCFVGNNVTIGYSIIGNNTIIHNGCRLGQDGFGFAYEKGRHVKVPQVGRVIIGENVEIGANTCIDRGSGPDTIVGDGTKIDNLVQIGHNVHVGKGCIIVSQVGISGSTKLGDHVMLGGQAGLAGHLKIGSQARIAAKSGVGGDVPAGESYGGYPAIPIKDWHRLNISLKKTLTRKIANDTDND